MSKEISKSEVAKLSSLVKYQEGAIVSRQILTKNSGNVTVFAFDKEQKLSEHTAPFDALVYILDGEAKVLICGNAHSVKKGEMIIMPENKPHALEAKERFKMLLIMIKK